MSGGGARGSVLDGLKATEDSVLDDLNSALLFFGGGDGISSNMGRNGFSERRNWTKANLQNHLSHTMRKPDFCLCKNKGADQLRSAFVFATPIV